MTLADHRRNRGEPVLPEEHAEEGHGAHPSALQYIQIGLILSVITAIEVAIYYVDMSHSLLVALLVVLSITKFSMVVMWFMHLRFDNRIFSTLFVTGLTAALILFTVVIAAEHGKLV